MDEQTWPDDVFNEIIRASRILSWLFGEEAA